MGQAVDPAISALPKVELHCHLDLIADPPMLREMQRRGLPTPVQPEALAAGHPVRSYDEFFAYGELLNAFEGDIDNYRPVIALHLERLKAQNVIYTEIMIGTSELRRESSEMLDKMAQFREYVTGLEDGRTQVEFLAAFSRTRPPEFAEQLADRLLILHEAGLIAGVAMAGPERGYPVRPFRRAFDRLREAGVPVALHAGEWAGPEAVWDALEHGHPSRIGHGVTLFEDERLIRLFQERQLHIEMCPTSNLRTGAVARIEDHPLGRARQLGLNFSINTDDPGPFACSMDSEHQLAAGVFGFGPEDFAQVTRNALAARFQPKLRYCEG